MELLRDQAGTLSDGRMVEGFTLCAGGYSARILTYGATLQAYRTPDRQGCFDDIVLGFDTVADYEAHRIYMGSTVGRYANRIGGGGFTLDGQAYRLDGPEGAPVLHGGAAGFDRQIWQVERVDATGLTLRHDSPDGEGGFPGAVTARAYFALEEDGRLTIDLSATTTRPTVIAMTSHAYYNLAGASRDDPATAMRMTIPASAITAIGADMIPTGQLQAVAGTGFDFRDSAIVGQALDRGDPHMALCGGLDHNFVLDAGQTDTPKLAVRIEHEGTGRTLDILSTEPGLQVYSAIGFNGSMTGKGGLPYRQSAGLALEPQKFPDTPNQPAFGSARLNPKETYRHRIALVPGLVEAPRQRL